jgi:hypothetical protein
VISTGTRRTPLLASVAVAVAAFTASSAPSADATESKRPLLEPKPGSAYGGGRPVHAKVRAHPHDEVSFRLNGVLTRDHEAPAPKRYRRLSLSPSHGLRHGRNVLRVKVRKFHGGDVRRRTVRFRVKRKRPLAAAGRDVRLGADARIRLDARADSRAHPRARSQRLRFRWRLLKAPADSSRPRLRGKRRAQPAFRPDAYGTYRLRLRVRAAGGRTGVDQVTLRADPPPALAIDTMAKDANGKWGIQVGETHYAADPGQWLQVVVLDRSLGTLRSNKSYSCPGLPAEAAVEACHAKVVTDLKGKLSGSDLVIAANQPDGAPGGTPVGPAFALQDAGLKLPRQSYPAAAAALKRGTYSAIGVPREQGTGNSATVNEAGAGEITGTLIRNNRLNYGFAPPDHLSFDTQAQGSTFGDSTAKNVIRVGETSYTENVGGGAGGIHVVVVDRRSMKGSSHWFATAGKKGQAALDVMTSMRNVLTAAAKDPDALVFLASRGAPPLDSRAYEGLTLSHQLYHAIRDTATAVQVLGGTRGPFYAQIDRDFWRGHSYTLVGHGASAAGRGEAGNGPGVANTVGAANRMPIIGTLTRTSNDYGYEIGQTGNGVPLGTHALSGPGQELLDAVHASPTPWPEQGNAGREAAIAYVGSQVGLTDDPRSQYYTRPFTTETWDGTVGLISGLSSDHLPANVSKADFEWARDELKREIGWLQQIHGFVETLAAPYAKTSLKSWADLNAVATEINDNVRAAPKDEVLMIMSDIFDGVRALTELFPETEIATAVVDVGKVFAAINAVYDSAMAISQDAKGESLDPEQKFRSSVATAGKDLADRLQDAQDTLTIRYANVIAADYGKLRTVAACTLGVAPCPNPDAWQLTTDDQTKIGEGLRASLRSTFYTSLLPARFDLWKIDDEASAADAGSARNWIGEGAFGAGEFRPFDSSPASAQIGELICRDMNDHSRDEWWVYGLGSLSGSGTWADPWKMAVPEASVTNTVVNPVDPARFPEGPLGNDRESFLAANFAVRGLSHYPHSSSITYWEHGGSHDCSSE